MSPAASAALSSAEEDGGAGDPEAWRQGLAIGGSVVPGLLVHGSGHLILGDTRTGLRLLAAEGIGLGLAAGSLTGLALTGASRKIVGPLALLTVQGASLFFLSALADIYGVVLAGVPRGEARRADPTLLASAGALFIHDPVLRHDLYARARLEADLGGWQARVRFDTALDTVSHRFAGEVGRRLMGTPDRFLDARLALRYRDHGAEGFDVYTAEARLRGRLPLRVVSPSLEGSFAELGWGLGMSSHGFDGVAQRDERELLLLRMAFGVWIGRWPAPWAEVILSYEHRRDTLAGGIKIPGVGAGNLGHVGIEATTWLLPRWGVVLEAEVGSAALVALSLSHRYGANP